MTWYHSPAKKRVLHASLLADAPMHHCCSRGSRGYGQGGSSSRSININNRKQQRQ